MKKVLSPISDRKMREKAARKPLLPRGPFTSTSCVWVCVCVFACVRVFVCMCVYMCMCTIYTQFALPISCLKAHLQSRFMFDVLCVHVRVCVCVCMCVYVCMCTIYTQFALPISCLGAHLQLCFMCLCVCVRVCVWTRNTDILSNKAELLMYEHTQLTAHVLSLGQGWMSTHTTNCTRAEDGPGS